MTSYKNYITCATVNYDTSEVYKTGGKYALGDIKLFRNDIVGGDGLCAHESESGELIVERVETSDMNGMNTVTVSVEDIIPAGKWRIN